MIKKKYLIVGNGLAGSLLTYFLSKETDSFILFSSPNKNPSSVVAGGMFTPLGGKRFLETWMAKELLNFAKETYLEIETKINEKIYHSEEIVHFLKNPEEKNFIDKRLNEKTPYIENYFLENNENFKNIKNEYGYLKIKEGGWVDITLLLNSLIKFFKDKLVSEELDFEYLIYKNDLWFYKDYCFENIIFCEGYHAINNPFFKEVKFLLCKGETFSIELADVPKDKIIKKGVYIVNLKDKNNPNLYKVGSNYEWKDLTENITEKGKVELKNKLDELLNTNYIIKNQFAGIRPTVSDRKPILGKHPNYNGLYIFNGLGTKGVLLSPYFANMLKDFILYNKNIPQEVNLTRFFSL
ncbi:MAG: FAD-binding oxidoreductase [Candidatus Sericytochromatia bacterium]